MDWVLQAQGVTPASTARRAWTDRGNTESRYSRDWVSNNSQLGIDTRRTGIFCSCNVSRAATIKLTSEPLAIKSQRPPARERPSNNRCACRPVALVMAHPLVEPIECQLRILEPLRIVVAQSREEISLFDWLLWRYHYLPYSSGAVGENIKYLVFDGRARPLACLLYGAAAWKLAVRDKFIGWSKQQREANLCYLANNLRFLILPWVRVKNLAFLFLKRFAGDALRRLGAQIWSPDLPGRDIC